MLIEKIYEEKAKKIRVTPCHTNRASEAGWPCQGGRSAQAVGLVRVVRRNHVDREVM
jgi:hypothetical protein